MNLRTSLRCWAGWSVSPPCRATCRHPVRTLQRLAFIRPIFSCLSTPCFGITPAYGEADGEGDISFMAYTHTIAAGHLRILFALLFTTVLGPIVLVALIAFAGYAFFTSRRGR